MKKSSFALAFTAVAMSTLVLSGCGMFRSHKDWDKAQQEAPLEIPPGLDTPSTSAALVIPDVGSGAAAAAAQQSGASAVSDGFVSADNVDNVYRRIGEALGAGDLGKVLAHDDTAHTYQLSVGKGMSESKPGLFRRMFGGGKKNDAADAAPSSSTPGTRQVVITVIPSGTGSEVRAQGDSDGVRRVVDSLKSRMGG
ncbi:hypothetical protein EC912_10390 [Luteibacter rhizovicinus]|uniref:Beta-barrel assembly machine subunit BamC n=1 Tax=Luteibacter rhizovicinus TaxID=242606 RepID=A0A4R3YP02_9GAMM|nr:hypothetical protein [Luteibacter rhizovicinus]TCV94605.1 hypothetical protein EC912_10390 [Luteibacter rhizovicinus]